MPDLPRLLTTPAVRDAALKLAEDGNDLGLLSTRIDHLPDPQAYATCALFFGAGFLVACDDLGVEPQAALAEVMLRGPGKDLRQVEMAV